MSVEQEVINLGKNIFFNAHHSPMGCSPVFTLGYPGQSGGFDLELGSPPNQNIYIGLQDDGQERYRAFPFFGEGLDERDRYTTDESDSGSSERHSVQQEESGLIIPYNRDEIVRRFGAAIDEWQAGDLTFRLISPFEGVPDPETATEEQLRFALMPAVLAEITVDNTRGTSTRKAFFGLQNNDPVSAIRRLEDVTGGRICGIGQGRHTAIARAIRDYQRRIFYDGIDSQAKGSGKPPVWPWSGRAVLMDTPAGEKATYRFGLCFYRPVRHNRNRCSYYYSRYFANIEEVAEYALAQFNRKLEVARQADALVNDAKLSEDQKFIVAHAIRSYYGSTELLEHDGKPLWIVNEGEYRMMNTFDLLVDQLFYELKMNPWTVKNELDLYTSRYSYRDTVDFPGDATEYPGGISFTHDMGVANSFSLPGYSSYELHAIDDCFSHMTHEQLVNWVLSATVYVHQTNDREWLEPQPADSGASLDSMVNRDHPDPSQRTGMMGLDSSRTMGGRKSPPIQPGRLVGASAEQHLFAGKSWAAYVAMEKLFRDNGRKSAAALAGRQPELGAGTITSHLLPGGIFQPSFRRTMTPRSSLRSRVLSSRYTPDAKKRWIQTADSVHILRRCPRI
uniref:Beta-xylosidase n=1 Tax=Geobacillus stearothermophilus TaxID=1422 RepID=XYLA2_GEOSE|nr:RecName: Full=Beta-xylosidase; AltName: Full=1,4-beta-D-xylan xylohydrolase; AltName: Full=Xylan 1,4-beta-xylosidase; Flags: Precursor [Geobacillus stearothermophilus]AAA50863.1 xylan 1,4-beta-xylosidase [Geobacillus stearothermophilus]